MSTKEQAFERACGYASGREDASGTKTVPAPGSKRGPDSGWLDFADAFAQAQDDYNNERRFVMTNCKAAYERWTSSGGRTIFEDALPLPGPESEAALYREARDWIADCWDDVDVASLSDAEIRAGVQRHYEGGWAAFARDAAVSWTTA